MNALNAESTRISFKEQFYLPDLTPQQSRYFERISLSSGSETIRGDLTASKNNKPKSKIP